MLVLIKTFLKLLVLTSLLVGLPLFGALLAGEPLAQYLEFPPLTGYVEHPAFSKLAFACFAPLAIVLFVGLVYLLRASKETTRNTHQHAKIPRWGWLACFVLIVVWILAWSRFSWFESVQAYTFTTLWVSFIIAVNALTYRNRGECLLTHQPRLLLFLFPVSSLFWWYFEYLNRFVQNWYYLGIESFSPAAYVIHASFAFSTVLPAVASVTESLASLKYFGNTSFKPTLRSSQSRGTATIILAAGSLALIVIPVWPEYLFALVWIIPLLLFVTLQIMSKEPDFFTGILVEKNWRLLSLPAVAALLCGFLWELWNYYSYAKWQYSIPFVQIFKLFEMPILGYAGYPIFGLECVVITEWLRRVLYPSGKHLTERF